MWLEGFDPDDNNTTKGGGFDANATLSSKKPRRIQTIVPMFIKQMQMLPDDLTFFGETVQMVEFVAVVRSQNVTSTKVVYELEDFTDTIVGHLWMDFAPGETAAMPNVKLNSYARVVGTLKSTAEGRRIMILSIRTIEDANVVVTQYLSAIAARYEMGKNCPEKIHTSNLEHTEVKVTDTAEYDKGIGTPFQNKVYKVIVSLSNDMNGGDVEQILSSIKCSVSELTKALEYLVNEGHVYTTVDDNHFKATDMAG